MRYARQPDKYSCGPTAILNALKWAGEDVSTKEHLPFLQFGCRTIDLEHPHDIDLNGTTDDDFDRVLRYVAKGMFRIRKVNHRSVAKMKAHLARGGAICFSYYWAEDGQSGHHFAFIEKLDRGQFVIVNDHNAQNEDTVTIRTSTTLRRWLKKHKESPCVWFLTLQD